MYGSILTSLLLVLSTAADPGLEIQVQRGHSVMGVHAVAVSPDGALVATGGQDSDVRLWRAESGELWRVLAGHGDQVDALDFSPDGRLLVSVSHDETLRFWDVGSGRLLATRATEHGRIHDVAFDPRGELVATAHADNTLLLWDVATRAPFYRLHTPPLEKPDASRDGSYRSAPVGAVSVAFDTAGGRLVSGHSEHGMLVWDLATGTVVAGAPELEGRLYAVAFSPDDETLATAGSDGVLRLWSTRTGEQVGTLEGHTDVVLDLVFLPSGEDVVTAGFDGTIRRWHGGSQKDQHPSEGVVYDLDVDPRGRWMVTAGTAGVRILDAATQQTLHTLEPRRVSVHSLAFSPDGRSLVVATGTPEVTVVDLTSGLARELAGHDANVIRVALSPDGSWLASLSGDQRLRLWRWPSGEPVETLDGEEEDLLVSDMEFSPDGKTLAVATMTGNASWVGGKLVVSGTGGGKATLWDLESRSRRGVLDTRGMVQDLAFSRDGARLATASINLKGGYLVWGLATREVLTRVDPPYIFRDGKLADVPFARSVVFSADGESLFGGFTNGLVNLWNLESRAPRAVVEHGRFSTALALSPDGRRLASGSRETGVRIWNAETLELLRTLEGHGSSVTALAFAPDGRSLAVGTEDGTLRLWRLADDKLLTLTHFFSDGEYLTQTPAGDFVASAGVERHVRWRLADELHGFAEHAEAMRRPDLVEHALAARSALAVGPPEPELSEADRRILAEAHRLDEKVDLLESEGRYREAVELAEDALRIKKGVYGAEHRQVAYALLRLGRQLFELKEYGRTESLYLRALEIWEASGAEKSYHAHLLSHVGELYRVLGQIDKAYHYQRKAYNTWFQSFNNPEIYVMILNNLGLVLAEQDRLEEARDMVSTALSILDQFSAVDAEVAAAMDPLRADVMDNLAFFHLSLGEDRAAEDLYLRAQGLRSEDPKKSRRRVEPSTVAPDLPDVHDIFDQQLRWSGTGPPPSQFGEPTWRTTITLTPRRSEPSPVGDAFSGDRQADSHLGLGRLARKRGDFGEARRHFERALELLRAGIDPRHPRVARVRGELALVEAATWRTPADLDKPVDLLHEAFRIETDYVESVLLGSTETEKVAFLEAEKFASRFFGHLVSLAPNLGEGSAALVKVYDAVLEHKLLATRTLSRQIESYFSGEEASAELLRKYRNLTRQISALRYSTTPDSLTEGRLQNLTRQLEALEDEMAAAGAGFRLDFRRRHADASEVAASLPEGTVLVDFVRFRKLDYLTFEDAGDHYLAFVSDPSGKLAARDLGSAQAVDSLVEAYREEMAGFDPSRRGTLDRRESEAALAELGHELYRRLFEPLTAAVRGAPLLPASGTVLLAPDGPLHLVPFETFVDGEGRYLVERYQFGYLGSGRDLPRFQEAPEPTDGFYVFAAPDYGEGTRFVPLDGTAALAETLRGLFDLPADHVFTGSAADEDTFYRLERPHRLHVATHGFFDGAPSVSEVSGGPLLRAGLAFAGANRVRLRPSPGDRADGIATALEISTLVDLRGTDLVVLSACETGVGEVRSGEGVFGLSRSFRAAGARSVVLSLWQVQERATEQLMTRFYQGLGEGLGKSAALRAAALAVKADERYSHPYFWGAFVCTGDPS